jgi:hypothetical protein
METLQLDANVITAEGTPLGGWVHLDVSDDGSYHVKFHMHSSSVAGMFDYAVRAYLTGPDFPTVAFLNSGHVSGVDSTEHEESGTNALLALYWPQVKANATFVITKDYEWGGVVGTINDLVKDLFEVGAGALGTGFGVIIAGTQEAVGWLGDSLGPGSTLGVVAGVVVFAVAAAYGVGLGAAVICGTVAGVTVGEVSEALIASRPLNDAEKDLARRVFGGTLPLHDVIITNLAGLGDRAFTAPGIDGKVYCNLGGAYRDPLGGGSDKYPAPGQLLIHELVHAWQIAHHSFLPGLVCSGMENQAQHTLGDDVYAYGPPGPDWKGGFNEEQQASIVDQWFGGSGNSQGYKPMSRSNPYYRYVVDDLREGLPIPDLRVTALRSRTQEGAVSLFGVGEDRRVWGAFWPRGPHTTEWSNWFPIGDATFPHGAPVAAVHPRTDERAVSLYVVGNDGRVWSTFWPRDPHTTEWSDWFPIGDATFPHGAPVAAVHPRIGEGAVSLYVVGNDGRVWTTFWPRDTEWSDWYPIGDTTFPVGAPVSVLRSHSEEGAVALFLVGNDGNAWSNFWPAAAGSSEWSGWHAISYGRSFFKGSEVTCIHPRTQEGAASLFSVASDGKVWTTYWPASSSSTNWADWYPIEGATFPKGEPVTALHPRSDEGAVSLFAVGNDGRAWTTFWQTTGWSGWYPIGDTAFPMAAAITAAHARSDEGATSLYVVGNDGRAWSAFWPRDPHTTEWSDWYPIGDIRFPR